jgi:hypothetical protein
MMMVMGCIPGYSQDGVYSFRMRGVTLSGDVPVSINTNGLQLTGQVGEWAIIPVATNEDGKASATDDGVTLEFDLSDPGAMWEGASGSRTDGVFHLGVLNGAIRTRSGMGATNDIPWIITGLTPNAYYDMVWYNKTVVQQRWPNSGVDGFNGGNGIGASAIRDSEGDQNFEGVQADGTGKITGKWYLTNVGSSEDITAVAGVQLKEAVTLVSELQLSSTEVASNASPGTVVGNLAVTYTNVDQYVLLEVDDHDYFDILEGGTNLLTATWMDSASYDISILATNTTSGFSTTTNFTITVTAATPVFSVAAEVAYPVTDGDVVGTAQTSCSGGAFSTINGRTDLFYFDGAVLKATNAASWGGVGTTNYVTIRATAGGQTDDLIVAVEVVNTVTSGTVFRFR